MRSKTLDKFVFAWYNKIKKQLKKQLIQVRVGPDARAEKGENKMKEMTVEEIKSAIKFGKDAVAEFKKRNEEVPNFIYDRIIELQEALIEKLAK